METDLQDGGGKTLSVGSVLCRLDEIEDPGSKGLETIDGQDPFFVVRRDGAVFGYRNSCPHYNAPLDWKPDAFLSYEKTLIHCSMHSALFRIEDGMCIAGPCPGEALEPVPVGIVDGKIVLTG